jgi:hypothetical protein
MKRKLEERSSEPDAQGIKEKAVKLKEEEVTQLLVEGSSHVEVPNTLPQ